MKSELYNQTLMMNHRNPMGWSDSKSISAQISITLHNAFCGDEITLLASFDNEMIDELYFTGECCAICRASASLMHQYLVSNSNFDLPDAVQNILNIMKDGKDFPEQLAALSVVHDYPVRMQCARLPWQAILQVLHQQFNAQEIQ